MRRSGSKIFKCIWSSRGKKYCKMSVTKESRVSGIRAELADQKRGVVRKSSGRCSLLRVVHGIPGGESVLVSAVCSVITE